MAPEMIPAEYFFGGSGYELARSQPDRIALNDEPDMTPIFPMFLSMTRTINRTANYTIKRARTINRTPLPAVDQSLSMAFSAMLDSLFFSLEPAVDKTFSHRLSEPCAMSCKQAYAAFEAPAYRRHGRLIPELECSTL
jgi:hypothetical protein